MQSADARAGARLIELRECRIRRDVNEVIAAEVRAELARQGLSQSALAGMLGWSQVTVSRRLRSAGQFTVGELEQVSQALNVSLSELTSPRAAAS